MSSLSDLRSNLILVRAAKAQADADLAALLEMQPELKAAIDAAADASRAVKEAESQLRTQMEAVYRFSGRDLVKAHQGLNVRVKTAFEIGHGMVDAVEEWARSNMPALLVLDMKTFEVAWQGGLIRRAADPQVIDSWKVREVEIVTPTISQTLE